MGMKEMRERSSGILMHISSLASDYGIGDFGKEAYEFVDFLEKAKQKYWQILPLGVTGFGDSPYQCFSAFGGNPYFIDLDQLIDLGYLDEKDVEGLRNRNKTNKVDYEFLYKNKIKVLRVGYSKAKEKIWHSLKLFYKENQGWLREFALFMSLKYENQGKPWIQWKKGHRNINSPLVAEFEYENRDEVYFWIFTQYFFFHQWNKLKLYANRKGVNIIGDLPIYLAFDSSDLWANQELFNLDEDLLPRTVAAVPPDDFSKKGQLWGNPIYNWHKMEEDEYSWWIRRMELSFKLYDVLRIDHFIGFESYYEVEYGSKTAIGGQRKKGPGIKLFNKIKEELGNLNIIAEDLGVVTPDVKELIKETGFPGMKVLQFAFDSKEESDHLPHNHDKNTVVYTGTHDNPTVVSWGKTVAREDLQYAMDYLNICEGEGLNWAFIRGAWSSPAYLAIGPIQDFLGLGHDGRMNTPSTLGGNWTFRIHRGSLTDELAKKIAYMSKVYGR